MAISAGQIGSALSALGVTFALEYVDRATDPLRKTEEQLKRTKDATSKLGDEADKASKKLTEMARVHESIARSSDRMLAFGTALGVAGYGVKGFFEGAIRGASELQNTLVGAQLRIQDTSAATYKSMKDMAMYMSTHFNVSVQDAASTIDALSGSFKNLNQIQAMVKTPGGKMGALPLLIEGSGGQLDASRAENLITNYMRTFHPDENLSKMKPEEISKRSQEALGRLFTTHQIGKVNFDQMDNFLAGVNPYVMSLRRMGDKNSETDMLALGTMMMQQSPHNPVLAGQRAGMIASVMERAGGFNNPLNGIGVQYNARTGVEGLVKALEHAGPNMKAYLNNSLDAHNPQFGRIEAALGGPYVGQSLQKLLQKGGLEEFQHNVAEYRKDPSKVIEEYRKTLMDTFKYQSGLFNNAIGSFSVNFAETLLRPATDFLKLINPIVATFATFLNDHPKMVIWSSRIAASTMALIAFGAAIKLASVAMTFLNNTVGLTTGRILLFGGIFSALGLLIGSIALAYTKNFGGMKDAVDRWFSGVEKPLEKYRLLVESIGEMFGNSGHKIHWELWQKDQQAGIGGIVITVAKLKYGFEAFFAGVKKGFIEGFKPFLDGLTQGMNQGGGASVLNGFLDRIGVFLKYLAANDFGAIGERIGKGFGTFASTVGGALKVIVPLLMQFATMLKDVFELVNKNPIIATVIGKQMGGPIGTILEASGAARILTGNNEIGKAVTAAYLGNDSVGRIATATVGANALGHGGPLHTAFGAFELWVATRGLKLPGGEPSAGQADASGIGDMSIHANNVYINGNMASSGGPSAPGGASNPGGTGAGPGGGTLLGGAAYAFHKGVEVVSILDSAALVGLVGALAIKHLPFLSGLKNVIPAFEAIEKIGPTQQFIKHFPEIVKFGAKVGSKFAEVANGVKGAFGLGAEVAETMGPVAKAAKPLLIATVLAALGSSLSKYIYDTATPEAKKRMDDQDNFSKIIHKRIHSFIDSSLQSIDSFSKSTETKIHELMDPLFKSLQTNFTDFFSKALDWIKGAAGNTVSALTPNGPKQSIADKLNGLVGGAAHGLMGSIAGAAGKGWDWGKSAMGNIIGAITGQESGGNYGAVNSRTLAMGRYQFMPKTAASYLDKDFLSKYGSTTTPTGFNAFLKNVDHIQDKVQGRFFTMLEAHAFKLSGIHNNTGLIAAGHYGGNGGMDDYFHRKAWTMHRDARYPNEPSIDEYVRSVNSKEQIIELHNHTYLDGKQIHHEIKKIDQAQNFAKRGTEKSMHSKKPGSVV